MLVTVSRTPINLYVATGFDTDAQLAIANVGSNTVRVGTTEAGAPSEYPVQPGQVVVNEEGDGAWAVCAGSGVVDVVEAG